MKTPAATTLAEPIGAGRIRRLSAHLINQIAAGEVVTRPAAALKELIENSLDAGAARIEVHVEDDALNFTVRDDGRGMDEDDLRMSIERHATSKIAALEDLESLTTRGFRGEALAALAAVSRLEIVTRAKERDEGRRLSAAGAGEPRVAPCGASVGTTIVVRDLFYNTPARLKFLKNPVAEWGHILQTTLRQALTRPDVAFSIRWKGRPYLDLAAGQTLSARLAEILPGEGGAAATPLLEVSATLHEAKVVGALAHPSRARRDRRHQYFFINGRPVIYRAVAFALEEAFRGLLMTQRYPMAAIMIEIPPDQVDVNVHPTKEEVRLRCEALVCGAVHRAAAEALRAADLVPTLQVAAPGVHQRGPTILPQPRLDFAAIAAAPAFQPVAEQRANQIDFVTGFALPKAYAQEAESISGGEAPDPLPEAAKPYAEPEAAEEATLIGRLRAGGIEPRAVAQIGLTYILADAGAAGMLVIDQHAAHEKIMYLDFQRRAAAGRKPGVQPLLIPHTIDVAGEEVAAMESLIPALAAAGFEVEPFGGRTFVVQALPVGLDKLDVPAFVRDLLDDIGAGDVAKGLADLRHKIAARAACRAAVKSGDPLGYDEMQRLVEQVMSTAEALRCPHGRPTMMLLTREQLDLQFGRLG